MGVCMSGAPLNGLFVCPKTENHPPSFYSFPLFFSSSLLPLSLLSLSSLSPATGLAVAINTARSPSFLYIFTPKPILLFLLYLLLLPLLRPIPAMSAQVSGPISFGGVPGGGGRRGGRGGRGGRDRGDRSKAYRPRCSFCNKKGHLMANCEHFQRHVRDPYEHALQWYMRANIVQAHLQAAQQVAADMQVRQYFILMKNNKPRLTDV